MASIPANSGYSAWFHYTSAMEPGATDPACIAKFIPRYGDRERGLFQKALSIEKTLPQHKPVPDFYGYYPTKFICWAAMPSEISIHRTARSPSCKDILEAEPDGIMDRLYGVQAPPVPGIDGQADWLNARQIISCNPFLCRFLLL